METAIERTGIKKLKKDVCISLNYMRKNITFNINYCSVTMNR